MNKFLKSITWAVAAINILFMTAFISAFMHFGDSYPGEPAKPPHAHWIHLLQALATATIGQLGLILSPIVVRKNLVLRIIVIGMMIPFIYFVILGDAAAAIRSLLNPDFTWQYDFAGNLANLLLSAMWVFTYGFNILALLFYRRTKAEFELP